MSSAAALDVHDGRVPARLVVLPTEDDDDFEQPDLVDRAPGPAIIPGTAVPDPAAPFEVRPEDEGAVQRVEGWFRTYAQTRDPDLRERIILAYLGLADRLAERYRGNRSMPLEDLRQVARLGLVKAVDRYEPERANPFIPYAVATVIGEIKRHLRDASWRLRVPRGTKDLALRLCRAIDELPQQLGHSPTVAELAVYLNASEEEVLEAVEVAQTRSAPSLDQPAGEDGDTVLGDFVTDNRFKEEPEDLLVLPELLRRLPQRERQIVLLRYVEELTQDEIAARMQMSQMHVSRLLRRAIERMRAQLVEV
jgi:RNA polymerase sigma-B factor